MKKITIAFITIAMLSMGICAHANQNSNTGALLETECGNSSETVSVTNYDNADNNNALVSDVVTIQQKSTDNGDKDGKYYYNWDKWQDDYEYWVECYLGIKNPSTTVVNYGIHPERTEEWWDEWIAEMLSEGLIEQSWYDEMIEKGYIIEVD